MTTATRWMMATTSFPSCSYAFLLEQFARPRLLRRRKRGESLTDVSGYHQLLSTFCARLYPFFSSCRSALAFCLEIEESPQASPLPFQRHRLADGEIRARNRAKTAESGPCRSKPFLRRNARKRWERSARARRTQSIFESDRLFITSFVRYRVTDTWPWEWDLPEGKKTPPVSRFLLTQKEQSGTVKQWYCTDRWYRNDNESNNNNDNCNNNNISNQPAKQQ